MLVSSIGQYQLLGEHRFPVDDCRDDRFFRPEQLGINGKNIHFRVFTLGCGAGHTESCGGDGKGFHQIVGMQLKILRMEIIEGVHQLLLHIAVGIHRSNGHIGVITHGQGHFCRKIRPVHPVADGFSDGFVHLFPVQQKLHLAARRVGFHGGVQAHRNLLFFQIDLHRLPVEGAEQLGLLLQNVVNTVADLPRQVVQIVGHLHLQRAHLILQLTHGGTHGSDLGKLHYHNNCQKCGGDGDPFPTELPCGWLVGLCLRDVCL